MRRFQLRARLRGGAGMWARWGRGRRAHRRMLRAPNVAVLVGKQRSGLVVRHPRAPLMPRLVAPLVTANEELVVLRMHRVAAEATLNAVVLLVRASAHWLGHALRAVVGHHLLDGPATHRARPRVACAVQHEARFAMPVPPVLGVPIARLPVAELRVDGIPRRLLEAHCALPPIARRKGWHGELRWL